MPMVPDRPGLLVDITVGGLPLVEYMPPSDEDDDTPTKVTRYIEAQSGSYFVVRSRINRNFKRQRFDVVLQVYIDGSWVNGVIWRKSKLSSLGRAYAVETVESMTYASENSWSEAKFMFSNLLTNETSTKSLDPKFQKCAGDLGEISVRCFHVLLGPVVPASRTEIPGIGHASIPEKALKGRAISRKAGGGAPVAVPRPNRVDCRFVDGPDSPFATFNFRYRSKGDLQAECIIPRSPSPVPLEDRPIDSLTIEEARQLICRQKERENERVTRIKSELKRERSSSCSNSDSTDDVDLIEVVHVPKRARVIDTIDLTNI